MPYYTEFIQDSQGRYVQDLCLCGCRGRWLFSQAALYQFKKKEIDSARHEIVRIDAEKIARDGWEKDARLIVVPGGRDLYYCRSLSNGGMEKMRAYVQNGGHYLGICAGAYFASGSVLFEKGGELEVCGLRELKFYPGVAEGPIYRDRKFAYTSTSGMRASQIQTSHGMLYAYFNGGCAFMNPENHERVEVWGKYADLPETPAACVACSVGEGRAFLCGVHIEHSSENFASDLLLEGDALEENEWKRRSFLRMILRAAGLTMSAI